jgi:YD repeat-containing protein
MIDGNGNRAELRYDGYDRQDRWTFPSTTRPAAYNDATQATALATAGAVNAADYEQYSYDANGNRINLRKRDTRNIAFAYDALNRMTSRMSRALRAGHVNPSQVPLEVIRRGNSTIVLNTRSRVALENAGMPQSRWRLIDRTNNAEAQRRLNDQLRRNGLGETDTSRRPTPTCSGGQGLLCY